MDRGNEAEGIATGSTRRDNPGDVEVGPPAPRRRDIRFTIVPSRVLRILLLVIVVLVALSTGTQMTYLYLPDFPLQTSTASLLSVDMEQSLPTLYSTVMMLVGALLCAGIAHGRRRQGTSDVRHWAAVSLIFGLLAIDEFASLHERLIDPFQRLLDIEGGPLLLAWVVPAIVAVSVFVVIFLPFLGRLPRPTRRGLLTAGVLFVSGAIGMEMFTTTYVPLDGTDIAYVLSATVEETLEMLGITVFLSTLLAYIPVGVPDARWTVWVATPISLGDHGTQNVPEQLRRAPHAG
jgi:hypothetical protein